MKQASFTYERPWMYPKQLDALFCSERYAVCEATTKSGKTAGCMVWLTEQAMNGTDGHNYWWIAPTTGVAKIAYRRIKRSLPPQIYHTNDTDLTITLFNGAVLWFKSGEIPDNLYGEDVYAAVIDECSRVREESWYAVRSTLTATRGPIRLIGNVKGRKNWFFKMARRAEAGAKNMHYSKITAYDAIDGGILDAEEIEDAKANLPEHVFQELYEAEPSDDGGNPFGLEHIRNCIRPLSSYPPVVFGVDLAKSHDWAVVIGLDAFGHVCKFERWHAPWKVTIARVRRICGDTPTLVDSTGVGDPIMEFLVDPEMTSDEDPTEDADLLAILGSNFTGYKFTQNSKQQLMEGLAISIQSVAIGFPEGVITEELSNFEFTYTRTGVRYSAPAGLFDDCVCALALADRIYIKPSALPFAATSDAPRPLYAAYSSVQSYELPNAIDPSQLALRTYRPR